MELDIKTIIIRTLIVIFLGGIIGIERESKHRPAGFRTHIMVCLGSAAFMMLAIELSLQHHRMYGLISDPARMGAQVVSGIGFLGAGTIIHYGHSVKGLTTAATLWAVAAVGLTIGAGFYELGIITAISIYGILFFFDKISKRINQASSIELIIELCNNPETLGEINIFLARAGVQISNMSFIDDQDYEDEKIVKENLILRIILTAERASMLPDIIKGIKKLDGVVTVEKF